MSSSFVFKQWSSKHDFVMAKNSPTSLKRDFDDADNPGALQNKKTKVAYVSDDWSSSSSDDGIEILIDPLKLIASNFPEDVKEEELMEFFEGTPLQVTKISEGTPIKTHCLATFGSKAEVTKAMKAKGQQFTRTQKTIDVTHQGNDYEIVYVTGFDKKVHLEDMKDILRSMYQSHGNVENVFLPADPNTGSSLGFGFILFSTFNDQYYPIQMDGSKICMRKARLKKIFQTEIESSDGMVAFEENEKTRLKKTLLPYKIQATILGLTEVKFSWTKVRSDLIPPPRDQEDHECWTIPLINAYKAVMKLKGKDKDIQEITSSYLEEVVDQAALASGKGITKVKYVVPVMEAGYVEKMVIHHRPRSSSIEEHEEFEKKIIDLLGVDNGAPLMVVVEVFLEHNRDINDTESSDESGDTQSSDESGDDDDESGGDKDDESGDDKAVYFPSEIESYQRTFENLPFHCLFLTGHGVYDGIDYWQLQESAGSDIGENGFVKYARHMCLIKQVVELRV
uniref:Nucleolin 1 n=1 Tax=Noccaea caerulescens TaxID=107243 RepID=A0A1J3D722_NOCCA